MTSTPPLHDPTLDDLVTADADSGSAGGPVPGATSGNVGDALRSIYQRTIQEDVPDEMIDLLGRLD